MVYQYYYFCNGLYFFIKIVTAWCVSGALKIQRISTQRHTLQQHAMVFSHLGLEHLSPHHSLTEASRSIKHEEIFFDRYEDKDLQNGTILCSHYYPV